MRKSGPARDTAIYAVLCRLDPPYRHVCLDDQPQAVQYAIRSLDLDELYWYAQRRRRAVALWAQLIREWTLIIVPNMIAQGRPVPPDTTRRRRAVSPQTRAKLRAAITGKKYGPTPPDVRAKISAAHRGRPKSAAHRAALSAAHRGKPWTLAQHAARRRSMARRAAV